MRLDEACDYVYARAACARSLSYSVGIFHADYRAVVRAAIAAGAAPSST